MTSKIPNIKRQNQSGWPASANHPAVDNSRTMSGPTTSPIERQ